MHGIESVFRLDTDGYNVNTSVNLHFMSDSSHKSIIVAIPTEATVNNPTILTL